jgi:hypothetical protein
MGRVGPEHIDFTEYPQFADFEIERLTVESQIDNTALKALKKSVNMDAAERVDF